MTKLIKNIPREKKISFIILTFIIVISSLLGGGSFPTNYLNYYTAIFFAAVLFCLKVFFYTLNGIETFISSKNWFQTALESILCFVELNITFSALKVLYSTMYPIDFFSGLLFANLVYFVQIYITKSKELYFSQLITLSSYIFAFTSFYLLSIYSPEPISRNTFLLSQTLIGYITLAVELYSMFDNVKHSMQ